MQYVLIFLGAGAGGASRHFVNTVVLRMMGPGFPLGTIAVNVIGSLLMGLLIGWLSHRLEVGHNIRPLLAVGFLGGFTTFSAFSLDAVTLYERGETLLAALYVVSSVGASIAALVLGLMIMRALA